MLLAFATALLLTNAASNAAPPDPCGPRAAALRDGARALYGEGDYLAAAHRYRSLWTCGGQPRDLLNAVQSYLLAERGGEAIDLWTGALASGPALDSRLRSKGDALIAAAVSHTTSVVVELAPEGRRPPATAELAFCRQTAGGAGLDPCSLRRTVAVARGGAAVALRLDRGDWQIQVRWPDRPDTTTRPLRVATEPLRERFTWRSAEPPRRLAAGLLAVGGLTAAAGLGVGLVGWQYNVTETAADDNFTGAEGLPLRTAGAALGGAGLALAGSGAVYALSSSPRVRRFGAAGLALGFGLAGAGAGLLVDASQRLGQYDPAPDREARCEQSAQCIAGEQLVGALAVGLGGGLVVGGIAGLIADPPSPRPARWSVAPELGRGHAGLRLRIGF